MKRVLLAACFLVVTSAAAWANDPAQVASKKPASAKSMETMKAEMAKCSVCKHMGAHLDEIGPMQMEVVRLDNGVAIVHSVPAAKADVYHKASVEMKEAGQACMTMTDEQAKTQLCSFCQELRGISKAGGKVSAGTTKNGDILVVTADDPAVQARITALASKCEMMAAESQASR
jgi:hypothetical protein